MKKEYVKRLTYKKRYERMRARYRRELVKNKILTDLNEGLRDMLKELNLTKQ
jgi:hypothetical protein